MRGFMLSLTYSLKQVSLPVFFTIILMLNACGGGGGGGSSSTDTVNELGLPATGTVDLAITDGSTVNSNGLPRLLYLSSAVNSEIQNIVNSRKTRSAEDESHYLYFGNEDIYYFFYDSDDAKWYGFTAKYTYNATTKTYTITDGDETEVGVIYVNGSTVKIFEEGDLKTYTVTSSFDKSVTMITEEEDDDPFDPTLSAPVINSLVASYSSGDITITYNITVPTGTPSSVYFRLASPSLTQKLGINENYLVGEFSVSGQTKGITNSGAVSGQTISGSCSFDADSIGAENGVWSIIGINVGGTNSYWITNEVHGDYLANYHYSDYTIDKAKDLGIAVKTVTVTGTTPDTTAPVMTSASISGTTLTITTSENILYGVVKYVNAGEYASDKSGNYEHGEYLSTGSTTATCDLSGATAGSYYIAMIALTDAAGNSSVYFGYDTSIPFWAVSYTELGLDFTKLNKFTGPDSLVVTTIGNLTFTKI